LNILEIQFKWTKSRKEYEESARPDRMANVSGLHWKIYGFDDEGSMATGIYLFKDVESLNKYLGPFIERAQPDGVVDLEYKVWEVQEGLSKITRAPI
jgi:hypothetical protein